MGSLKERYDQLNQPVTVTVTLPVQVLARIEGSARERGQTREQAVVEAVEEQNVRRARSENRRDRLELQKALRQAKDQEPVKELIARFQKQMETTPAKTLGPPKEISSQVLTGDPLPTILPCMSTTSEPRTLRQRREALGLSREHLARLADVSMASIAQFEGGLTPKESRVLGLVEAALRQQERLAA